MNAGACAVAHRGSARAVAAMVPARALARKRFAIAETDLKVCLC